MEKPDFGINKDNGCFYPIIHKVVVRKWPFINFGGNRICVDLFVLGFLLAEVVALGVSGLIKTHGSLGILHAVLLGFVAAVLGLRLLNMLASITSNVIRGSSARLNQNRTFFLGFVNLVELFVIFAFAYLHLPEGSFVSGREPLVLNWLDSLYYSVVVGTTLGFGDIAPLKGGAKALTAVQPLVILYIILNFISYVRGSYEEVNN